jgi:hypothetical protein
MYFAVDTDLFPFLEVFTLLLFPQWIDWFFTEFTNQLLKQQNVFLQLAQSYFHFGKSLLFFFFLPFFFTQWIGGKTSVPALRSSGGHEKAVDRYRCHVGTRGWEGWLSRPAPSPNRARQSRHWQEDPSWVDIESFTVDYSRKFSLINVLNPYLSQIV